MVPFEAFFCFSLDAYFSPNLVHKSSFFEYTCCPACRFSTPVIKKHIFSKSRSNNFGDNKSDNNNDYYGNFHCNFDYHRLF